MHHKGHFTEFRMSYHRLNGPIKDGPPHPRILQKENNHYIEIVQSVFLYFNPYFNYGLENKIKYESCMLSSVVSFGTS